MKTRQKYLTEAEDTTTPEHYLWTRETHMEMVRREGRYYVKDTKPLPTQYHSHYRGRTKLVKNKNHAI